MVRTSKDAPQSMAGLTGWAALEDHVRMSDERTVQDYKEDMDALLVFVSSSMLRAIPI